MFKMILAKNTAARTATRLLLIVAAMVAQPLVSLNAKEDGPQPPVGGQGGGNTGGTGGSGNGGGYATGSTGVTSAPTAWGRGTTPDGSAYGSAGATNGPTPIGCVLPAILGESAGSAQENCGGAGGGGDGQPACDGTCGPAGSTESIIRPLATVGRPGPGAGCMTCSPSSGPIAAACNDFAADDVYRIWIPNDRVHNSSLSPGFYTQFDSQMHLYPAAEGSTIYYFDVYANRTFEFVDGLDGDTADGVFHDVNNGHARKVELLGSTGSSVTGISQATSVRVTHWNGSTETFQVIDLDPSEETAELAARLTKREDRNGYALDVTYKTFSSTELASSPSRQWQIDTATDDFGNTLTFTYNTAQQSGRWALSQVTRQDSSTVSFAYSSGALASATFPDSAQSVYTHGQDTVSQTATLRIQEARGKAFDLVYHLTNDYMTVGTNVISQPTGIHRLIKTTGGDVRWMLIPNSDPNVDQNFIFQGGNLAFLRNGDGSYQQYQQWSCTTGGTGGYSMMNPSQAITGIEGELDTQVAGAGTTTTLTNLYTGQIPSHVDTTGRTREFEYDADRNITKVTYPADNTYEDYSYNSFGQVTRKRSRTGDVELFTYDSKGNLLTHSTGLKEVSGTDQQTAAYSQVSREYYPTTGANAGLLKTEKSALYNASTPTLYRTDYEYDTSNRLTKKIDPATDSGQSRPETTYEYDAAGRLVEVVDPLNRVTTFAYDSAGRQTQVTYPDTSTEQTLYGTGANAGRVVATKNRVGTVTTYNYDSSGRLTQTVVGAAVDANILDGNAYDTTVTDPNLKQVTEYTYLAGSDSLKTKVKNNGAVTDYTIDFKNRVTEVKQYPRVGTTLTSKKSYLENQLLYDEDAYGRRKYYGYRESDGTLIRTITCTHPGYTLADFDAV